MRILVTDGMDKSAMAALRANGHEVVEQFYAPEELGAALRDFDCVVIRSATKIRKAQLEVPFPWFPLSYSLSLLQSPGLSCSSPFDLFPFPVGEKHSDAFFFKD